MEHTELSEKWRVIPSWPDYAASSLGRIRRETETRVARAGRVLSPCIAGRWKSYLGVRLWIAEIKTGKTVNVQNLVAETFLGPRPVGMEINHKNGVTTDNSAANLEYVTKRQNEDHAVAHGLHPMGVRHGSSKLTEEQVRAIRADKTWSLRRIAAKYGVANTTILSVRNRKTWKHIA